MNTVNECIHHTHSSNRAEDVAQLVGFCLACMKRWVGSSALNKPGMVAHAYKPSTWEVKAGESEGQGYSWPNSESEVNMGYMKPNKKNKWGHWRDGSAIKDTGCSSRGLKSQYPYSGVTSSHNC